MHSTKSYGVGMRIGTQQRNKKKLSDLKNCLASNVLLWSLALLNDVCHLFCY